MFMIFPCVYDSKGLNYVLTVKEHSRPPADDSCSDTAHSEAETGDKNSSDHKRKRSIDEGEQQEFILRTNIDATRRGGAAR